MHQYKKDNLVLMDRIETLATIDKNGNRFSFDVSEEPLSVGKYSGIYYKISEPKAPIWKHFVFQILFVDDSKILVFMIDNQNIPELSGKGIVKSMIEKIRSSYKMTIISSTNIDSLKHANEEGRVPNVTQYWIKWSNENMNIKYNNKEDRFYYNYC